MVYVWVRHRVAVVLLSTTYTSGTGMLPFQLQSEVPQGYLEWQHVWNGLEYRDGCNCVFPACNTTFRLHFKPLPLHGSFPESCMAFLLDVSRGAYPWQFGNAIAMFCFSWCTERIKVWMCFVQVSLSLMCGHVCFPL